MKEYFRWAIVFKYDNQPKYELWGDKVMYMLGYITGSFSRFGKPVKPWELYLKSNFNGVEMRLTSRHFEKNSLSPELFIELRNTFSEWDEILPIYKDNIFLELNTGKATSLHYEKVNIESDIEAMRNGTYEAKQEALKVKYPFWDVLDVVFNPNK